jgi:hypothetical protein
MAGKHECVRSEQGESAGEMIVVVHIWVWTLTDLVQIASFPFWLSLMACI